MNKTVYKFLTFIPVVGSIFKAINEPIQLTGSMDRENVEVYRAILEEIREYEKRNPKKQITRKIVDRIISDRKWENRLPSGWIDRLLP